VRDRGSYGWVPEDCAPQLFDEFGTLVTNTDCGSYWGTPLGVADRGRGKFILAYRILGCGM